MPYGHRGWQFAEKPDTRGYSEPLQEPFEIAPGDSQWGQFCSVPTTREEVAFRFELIVRSPSKTLKNIWPAPVVAAKRRDAYRRRPPPCPPENPPRPPNPPPPENPPPP